MNKDELNKKTVVFIETNFSGLYAIEYCRNQNYQTVLITDSYERFKKWFPAAALSKLDLVDKIIKVSDSSDTSEILDVIKNQLGTVDALITFAEIRTKTAAFVCAELGLRGSNVRAIELAQDKYQFRQILGNKGVEQVKCLKLSHAEELDSLDKQAIKFPCFVKPVHGHSSIGASVCHTVDEIRNTMHLLAQTSEDCVSSEVVIEDYLVGDLVSVELLTIGSGMHQIVGISDRDIVKDSVETGASFPLQHSLQSAIESKACAALDALGYDFGASHVELIITPKGPFLVEINTRVGGSGHSVMLDLATARSIVGDCIELCLGQLNLETKLYHPVQGSAWKSFVYPAGGLIKKLPSLQSIKEKMGVTDVWFHYEEGESLGQLNSNFNWIAQVMCTGVDQLDAKKNAHAAIDFIAANTLIS